MPVTTKRRAKRRAKANVNTNAGVNTNADVNADALAMSAVREVRAYINAHPEAVDMAALIGGTESDLETALVAEWLIAHGATPTQALYATPTTRHESAVHQDVTTHADITR